jgi:putative glycosyltransferase (TIGR04348 family)
LNKPHIIIISPASAKANNGNWQTASRWARFLRERYRVSVLEEWDGREADAMIALHARRSARSIAAVADIHPDWPLVVVLTGTDLYRDIRTDASAQRSLLLADRLVVLQDAGVQELEPALRPKTRVIFQSAPALTPHRPGPGSRLRDITMIGHLREEKDPRTFMDAARLVTTPSVRFTHIGGALDPALAESAMETQGQVPHYRWLHDMPHAKARQHLKRSHLMAIASRMEGGANVIIEAVTSGVPVLASDISGNRGMLGDDYAGYFPVGDSRALAGLIERAVSEPAFHAFLQHQCQLRAPLFSPQRERAAVLDLVDQLLASPAATD